MDKFSRPLSTASYPVRLWAKPSFANATCTTLIWIFPCDSCFLQPNLPGLQALCFLHCCIHNNREFYPSPVCSPVSLSPSLNDKPGKWVHCPYQFFCSLGAGGRLWPRSGYPALPEDRPGGGVPPVLRSSATAPGPPEPSRVPQNPKPQQLRAALGDHFQFRRCPAIFTPTRPAMHVNGVGWAGGRLSSTEPDGPARRVKVPLGGMPCIHGLLSYPAACLSMVWFFSLPCLVSLCLHKALNFRMSPMPSEFPTQEYDLFKSIIQHLLDIYQPRQSGWAQISWPFDFSDSHGISCWCSQ